MRVQDGEDRPGQPVVGSDPKKPRLTIIINNLLEAPPQHATQNGMMTKLGLLKSGKLTPRCVIDQGDPL